MPRKRSAETHAGYQWHRVVARRSRSACCLGACALAPVVALASGRRADRSHGLGAVARRETSRPQRSATAASRRRSRQRRRSGTGAGLGIAYRHLARWRPSGLHVAGPPLFAAARSFRIHRAQGRRGCQRAILFAGWDVGGFLCQREADENPRGGRFADRSLRCQQRRRQLGR
jgi:hypothetical protein